MTNMSIQPLWLTNFIEILLVIEFQLTKFIVGVFSYKAHFRPQISSNGCFGEWCSYMFLYEWERNDAGMSSLPSIVSTSH